MVIIGFLGKKQSGKDTSADYLIKKYFFKKRSFATGIKKSFIPIFYLNHRQLFGDLKEVVDERWGVTPRQLMQFFGTDLMRKQFHKCVPEIGSNIWLKNVSLWYENDKKNKKREQKVIFADCRFQNEVDLVVSLGGIVIKLERDGLWEKDEHISESGIDKVNGYTHLIKNNGTLEDLYNKLDNIMKEINVKLVTEKHNKQDDNLIYQQKVKWILENLDKVPCKEDIEESLTDHIDFIVAEMEESLQKKSQSESVDSII